MFGCWLAVGTRGVFHTFIDAALPTLMKVHGQVRTHWCSKQGLCVLPNAALCRLRSVNSKCLPSHALVHELSLRMSAYVLVCFLNARIMCMRVHLLCVQSLHAILSFESAVFIPSCHATFHGGLVQR